MQELYDILIAHIRGMWRFRWRALLVAWLLAPIGWLVVFVMPDVYEAKASVFVNTESALRDLTKGLVIENDLLSQLQLVKQTMLSRENLEKVARDTDLDMRVVTAEDMEDLMTGLRERINITGGERRRDGRNNLYTITFQDQNREQSLAVVQSLLNTFLEDTVGVKIQGNDDAQKFLEEQIADYEQRLSAAEKRLADFKRDNIGLLPGAESDYFTRIQSEINYRDDAQSELRLELSKEQAILAQLAGETEVVPGAATGPTAGTVYDQRLAEAQRSLEELLLRFTDKHPSVVASRETIARLEQERDRYYASLGSGGTVAGATATANPVFQQLKIQLNETRVQIARLRSQIADRNRRLAVLEEQVTTVPQVEAELARLNRDYAVNKDQYEALVGRLEVAKVTERKDQSEEVDFRIIDPPTVGIEPVAPKRLLLIAGVLIAALGAGGALAFVFDQLKPVFNTTAELQRIVQRPVLGAVSRTWQRHQAIKRRISVVSFAGGVASLLGLFAFVVLLNAAGLRLT